MAMDASRNVATASRSFSRQGSDAGGFVTTEKDAVNLGGFMDSLEPLSVVSVKMELTNAANVVDTMLRVIAGRRRRS